MSNIKYRQLVDGRWHYWGYVDGCFVGPITNQEPKPVNCQFTGLHDAKGVELYEGDIIKDDCNVAVVKFNTSDIGSCGCCWTEFQGVGFAAFTEDGSDSVNLGSDCEVIGNIYENPELL